MPTTYAVRPILPVRAKGDEEYRSLYPLAEGEDFEMGTGIHLDGGEIEEPGNVGAGTQPGTGEILGFSLASVEDYEFIEDTFEFTEHTVPVALSNQEFRGTLEGTFAAADVGSEFGFGEKADAHGTNLWTVDRSVTGGDARVIVTGVDENVSVGDIDVPCTFRVLVDYRQVIG